jgi:hypothetical protein
VSFLCVIVCGSSNFYVIGNLLLKRLLLAITQAIQTHNDFVILTENLKAEIPEELTAMRQALEAWEADQSQPDPYRLPKSSEFSFFSIPYNSADGAKQM